METQTKAKKELTPTALILGVLLAVVFGVLEFISLRMPLGDIDYDIYFSRSAVEPDEPFEIISKVGSRRRIPVSLLPQLQ